jgi:hypothetical protein
MIEKIYQENVKDNLPDMQRLDFPTLVRFCRRLMGLQQYACAEYLGFEHPRYKKLELGKFSKPLKEWEIMRLETFFKLPCDMLQTKQKQYLTRGPTDRMEKGKHVWNDQESTAAVRNTKVEGGYNRVNRHVE